MYKEVKCKYCGGRHYSYRCYKKPATAHREPVRRVKKQKMDKVVSGSGMDRRKLIKRLDTLVSQYVRYKDSDRYGKVSCYTCGARYHWKDVDCGHFISRKYQGTRWDLQNLRVQCLTKGHKVGEVDISEVRKGDIVPSMLGDTKVVGVMKFMSPIVRIEYEGGVIKSSPEHRILVCQDVWVGWMSAEKIYEGFQNGEDLYVMQDVVGVERRKILKVSLEGEDVVYALQTENGTYLADGVVHHNCQFCNRYLNGNYSVYTPKITNELGMDKISELWNKAYSNKKISTPELEEMRREFKNKLVELKKLKSS